jgi:hypothetical protein
MRRIFTPHDNDLGVWVCSVGIFPTFFFTRAISHDKPGAHVNVKFGHISHDRRKYFLKDQALPLNCWDCGEIPERSNHWQLFAIGDEAGSTFMEECDLNNLQFPIQIAGVILIASKEVIEVRRRAHFEFGWATNQGLPLVIAAPGYDGPEFSPETFCHQFGPDPMTPVVAGSALRWHEEPEVDPEFVKRVLAALYKRIEARS